MYKSPPRLRLFTKDREESFLAFKWFMDTNWRVRFHKCFLLYFCQPISFHLPLFTVKCPLTHLLSSIKRTLQQLSHHKRKLPFQALWQYLASNKSKKTDHVLFIQDSNFLKNKRKADLLSWSNFTYLKIVVTSIKVARFQNFTQA